MLFLTVCLFFNHCAATERDYTETKLTKQTNKQTNKKTLKLIVLFYSTSLFVDDF